MTFAREALPFVLPASVLAVVLMLFGHSFAGFAALVLAVLLLLFFRIPTTVFEADQDIALAPAFGRVTRVEEIVEKQFGDEPVTRIVTFLSVFDVHIQRAPVSGAVEARRRFDGRKVAAFRPEAAEVNASELSVLREKSGAVIGVRQVVGLVARRIVCTLREGDDVRRGDMIGLIMFGSRVDLLLPTGWDVLVTVGDRVKAGQTPMARRPTPENSS